MKLFFLTALLFITSVFSSSLAAHAGHSHGSDVAELEVKNAQVRAFLPVSSSSVAYLTIINHSAVSATLKKVEIDGLGRVEIHEHAHVNGMMKMQQVDSVTISAHQTVNFQPGGYHLMVFEPQEPLKVGQERKLTLYFNDGNRLFVNAQVVSLNSQVKQLKPSMQHTHH